MADLDDKQSAEFLQRSYTAVDGLWFMKVEEKLGFKTALEIDQEVWKVMPKIQARMMKSLLKAKNGIEALFQCFTAKLVLDGFTFTTEKYGDAGGFSIIIEKCPWYHLMVKSGRDNISAEVGTAICTTEYSDWASEFGEHIHFEMEQQICKGADCCVLKFSTS